jgi:hypothetical protein
VNDPHPTPRADLRLEALPDLPQSRSIRALAPRIWRDTHVVAIWLGGSLAAGTADPYSDIDLRVAVPPADLAAWESPDLPGLLGGPPLSAQFLRLSDSVFLHHLIVPNGDILDLLVQSAGSAPGPESVLLLGCRDAAFASLLATSDHTPHAGRVTVSSDAVRELIVAFWVNSHKHRKVLYRHLDLMFPAATYTDWRMLMRLWYIAATGYDTSPSHFTGIHGLTELVRAVERDFGAAPLALCGAPTRDRNEICAAIERYQDTVAQLGRRLASQYDFAYPAALEDVARHAWRAFRAASAPPPQPGPNA